MPLDDPNTWAQGAGALKSAFDAIRGLLGVVKDVRGLANPEQAKAITAAADQVEAAAKIAEAEIAKALGYEICKCQFPPTPMLAVGYHTRNLAGHQLGEFVYECPKCGLTTAGPFGFERTAPPRDAKQAT
jgi:hypothetical protein